MSKGSEFFAPFVLLPTGWEHDARIKVDAAGAISAVELVRDLNTLPPTILRLNGPVIPGFPNGHSHAFQRGMAGLAEWRASDEDSFWSWRDTMYQFVLALDPVDLRAIAEYVYAEMMVHGYTSVTEFHYVHRDRDGEAYSDIAELSLVILEAAEATGMGVTILPTLYGCGGLGGQPLEETQRRFRTSAEDIATICQRLKRETANSSHRIGMAAHSLRAVDPNELTELVRELTSEDAALPIHMHIAEQRREVDDCLAWCGQRPVQWTMDNLPVSDNWCLIHATHVMASELAAITAASATVCVCPTTEANLGDGVFPATRFAEQHGSLAIGSDSHVCVSPFAELCQLEYMQRLVYQRRNMLSASDQSTGRLLAEKAWRGGGRACGRPVGQIAAGHRADFIVLDPNHPQLVGREEDQWLDSLVFCGSTNMIDRVYVGGQRLVDAGQHVDGERLTKNFREAMQRVLPRMQS